jgi:hypothetical protein
VAQGSRQQPIDILDKKCLRPELFDKLQIPREERCGSRVIDRLTEARGRKRLARRAAGKKRELAFAQTE